MQVTDELLLLASLINDDQFFRKTIPFFKTEYFNDEAEKQVFKAIKNYTNKYNEPPNFNIIKNILSSSTLPSQTIHSSLEVAEFITTIDSPKDSKYVMELAEKFCQKSAIFCAVTQAVNAIDNKDEATVNALPEILREAISVCFDTSVGMDYNESAEERWDYYVEPSNKIPFDIEMFNTITNGGVETQGLHLIAAAVNVGKTFWLVYLAAMYMRLGYDVLYVSNEMKDKQIGKRVDASLLNVPTKDIVFLGKEKYMSKLETIRQKTTGNLQIVQYPTNTCSANKIRRLLRDLSLKRNFKPKIIINDYIQINISDNMPQGGNMGDYYQKVAEEMRAVAVEEDVVIWTAAQVTTDAMSSTDPELWNLAGSQGIARTADLVWFAIRTEQLDAMNQMLVKQVKTRYHETRVQKMTVGSNIGVQRIYEVNDSAAPNTVTQSSKQESYKNERANPDKPMGLASLPQVTQKKKNVLNV